MISARGQGALWGYIYLWAPQTRTLHSLLPLLSDIIGGTGMGRPGPSGNAPGIGVIVRGLTIKGLLGFLDLFVCITLEAGIYLVEKAVYRLF